MEPMGSLHLDRIIFPTCFIPLTPCLYCNDHNFLTFRALLKLRTSTRRYHSHYTVAAVNVSF